MRALPAALLLLACTPAGSDDPADAGTDAGVRSQIVEATIGGEKKDFSARTEPRRFEGQAIVNVKGFSTAADQYPELSLAFPGTVGRHACSDAFSGGEVSIGFAQDEDLRWSASNIKTDTPCVIDIESLDAAGGRWKGTFTATMRDVRGEPKELVGGRFDVPAP